MTQEFIKWLETNRVFYVDEVRKWLREYDNAEISFSKFVELFNQKVFESQQPIPQDINKWIEDEAQKEEIYEPKYGGKDHSGYDTMMKYEINYERSECFEKGAKAMYQLLLPELQQLREENESLIKQQKLIVDANAKLDKQIEQQKSQIDELKNTLNHELEVHKEFIQQAAEIESLKKEIGELKEINEGLRLSRNEYREAWENRFGKTT